jgi:hypothetical protein
MVPVKPERNAERGFYHVIPGLTTIREWNNPVPAYVSVVVETPPKKPSDREYDVPGGCSDGIDNDGDGWVDLNDTDCALPCNCRDGFRVYNREGDVVYVTAASCSWGPPWVNVTHSCIQRGYNYPACDYCDDLEYGGFTDWILPAKDTMLELANCSFVRDADWCWSFAYCVGAGELGIQEKTSILCVCCVRG